MVLLSQVILSNCVHLQTFMPCDYVDLQFTKVTKKIDQ